MAFLQAHDIPYTNVLLHPNEEDIAFVASTNHLGKMWTVHALASKWWQCESPFVAQGIVYKHVMKVFKMLHPNIRDGSIVRETGTLHKVTLGGVVPKHNSLNYGIGDNETKNNDPINKQLGQKLGLEFKDHLKSIINEDVIDVIDKVFSDLRATTMEFPTDAFAFNIESFERETTKHVNVRCCQLGTPSYHNFVSICSR
jgi:hypothetical protein